MRKQIQATMLGLVLLPGLSMGQTAFNGTWRPDPQRPGPDDKPTVVELIDGQYECKSCAPPYKVKADGHDQAVSGVPYYDTLSVTVADERTVLKTAKKGGQTVAEIKDAISADGGTLIETQTVTGMMPRPFEFAKTLSRVAAGPPRSHLLSGQWRFVEGDLTGTQVRISGLLLGFAEVSVPLRQQSDYADAQGPPRISAGVAEVVIRFGGGLQFEIRQRDDLPEFEPNLQSLPLRFFPVVNGLGLS